jgi:hypothetical protein
MSHTVHPAKIRYEYDTLPEARLQYVHGVWGGINPQGDIEMNFYLESDKMPAFSERLISPDGSLGHEITPEDTQVRTITRQINAKIALNYSTARAILEWLEDKVEMLEMEENNPAMLFKDDAGLEQ